MTRNNQPPPNPPTLGGGMGHQHDFHDIDRYALYIGNNQWLCSIQYLCQSVGCTATYLDGPRIVQSVNLPAGYREG